MELRPQARIDGEGEREAEKSRPACCSVGLVAGEGGGGSKAPTARLTLPQATS